MKEQALVKRYADAFLGYARGSVGEERAVGELRQLKEILRRNPDLAEFLKYRGISAGVKSDLLEKALSDFSRETRHFLNLLLKKRRMEYLAPIADYVRRISVYGGAQPAVVSFSCPMDLEDLAEIRERLERKFGRKFKLYLDLDPSLLSGVRIRIGNTVIDGSLRRRLDNLKSDMKAVRIKHGD